MRSPFAFALKRSQNERPFASVEKNAIKFLSVSVFNKWRLASAAITIVNTAAPVRVRNLAVLPV